MLLESFHSLMLILVIKQSTAVAGSGLTRKRWVLSMEPQWSSLSSTRLCQSFLICSLGLKATRQKRQKLWELSKRSHLCNISISLFQLACWYTKSSMSSAHIHYRAFNNIAMPISRYSHHSSNIDTFRPVYRCYHAGYIHAPLWDQSPDRIQRP